MLLNFKPVRMFFDCKIYSDLLPAVTEQETEDLLSAQSSAFLPPHGSTDRLTTDPIYALERDLQCVADTSALLLFVFQVISADG